jgi:hypothetical protein
MIGFLTMTRCKHATILVDQASRLSCICPQKTATAEDTLLGKEAFELQARERDATIQTCHAHNGIFKAHKWVMACRGKGQSLTFVRANARHQSRIAERRIRILQELTRTMLVHGNKRLPKAVTNNLWPHTLRMAKDALIGTPVMQNADELSPHQLFSNTRTQPDLKHWKPFGCPVRVLDSSIQGGGGTTHKWKQRLKVGPHFGRLPQRARSVVPVLDRQTALVSPQFHVMFDPSFQQDEFDSKWQLKAGFVAQKEPEPKNVAKAQVPQGSKSKTALDNQATESPPKRQRRKADRSESNNQLQHHDLEIPSQQPEPPEEPVRNEDEGSLGRQTTKPRRERANQLNAS